MVVPDHTPRRRLRGHMILLVLLIGWCVSFGTTHAMADDFWSDPQHGGNCFNEEPPDADYFEAAAEADLSWIRLTWSKWPSADPEAGPGGFLQGNADAYSGLIEADLATLTRVLDDAHSAGVRVVLVPLSLPGVRWRQHNDDQSDPRLWQDMDYHKQAADFWRDLARVLADHPAVVAYNFINEPHPARAVVGNDSDAVEFAKQHRDQPGDLNRLYITLAEAVREVDDQTPLMLDGPDFASPAAIDALRPLPDRLGPALYGVHLYDPWSFTSDRHQGEWAYPSEVELPWGQGVIDMNAAYLASRLDPVDAWATQHNINTSQLALAEYGCRRYCRGAAEYLADARAAGVDRGWHSAFYAFREDAWPAMDYELGPERENRKHRHDNPLWRAVRGIAP